MKIVQINASYNRGSIGRTTAELHNWLLTHGEESYVFTPQLDVNGENVFVIGGGYEMKIHAFLSRLFGLQAYFSFFSTRKIIRKLDEIQPDIIHLRNLHANYINLPAILNYISKKNINCVVTLHDCWLLTGHCCYYTKIDCRKWLDQCHNCALIKEDNNSWFFDFSRKMYNDKKRLFNNIRNLAVLGNSKWTLEQAQHSYLKGATIVDYVYNWIDRDTFFPRNTKDYWNKLNIQKSGFVILGVCEGWCKAKGLHIFIQLANKFPEWKFVLVGGIVENVVLPSNIIDVKRTQNNDELCEYYTHADVLLNPSVQETFGKVSAEALCCGTPIIVNRATANPELVGEGCGYIVDNNDVNQYAKYLAEINANGKQAYSKTCIEFATNNFDKETNIKANISIYKRLINATH